MVTIPWSDGSGDNLYLDYESNVGDQVISITSDINHTGVPRSKVVTFKNGNSETVLGTLSVTQIAHARTFNGSDDIFVDIQSESFGEKFINQ